MATLAFSSAKYDKRAGRAEMVAGLVASGHEFTTTDGSKVKFDSFSVDDKKFNKSNEQYLVEALKNNKKVVLFDKDKPYSLSSLEKKSAFSSTKSGFNAGDVAEGIFAIALAARFTSKTEKISTRELIATQSLLTKRSKQNSDCVIKSKNANPKIFDDVILTVNLAEVNLDAALDPKIFEIAKDITSACLEFANSPIVTEAADLFYFNNQHNAIWITADGIGDQKGTKLDVSIKVSNGVNSPVDLNLNVSLKAGFVKQFGQVGGSEFKKQEMLFSPFNFKFSSSTEKKYEDFRSKSLIGDALNLTYGEFASFVNRNGERFGDDLKKAITKYMIGDEDIILVQLNKKSSIYDPRKLVFSGKISAEIKVTRVTIGDRIEAYPKLSLYLTRSGKKFHILDIRTKVENGSYVRNYIEKGNDLHSLQVE